MSQEVFGPILPCCVYTDINEVIETIHSQPKPLSLYCFSNDSSLKERLVTEVSCGSMMFNDCVMQLSNPHLPFGGVGASGMGRYHGYYTFQTFTHQKSVLYKSFYVDILARYPPYCLAKRNVLRMIRFIEYLLHFPSRLFKHFRQRVWSSYRWRALIIILACLWVRNNYGNQIRIAWQLLNHVIKARI